MMIIGAGLAGLIAAHAWPTASVLEAAPAPRAEHNALLRFRSDAVARLVGIEFRPVKVNKGIWLGGAFVSPTIRTANLYSRKVLDGRLNDRSIWNLEPVTRWIAPESLYEQLVESVGGRITWGSTFDWEGFAEQRRLGNAREPLISTAPLGSPLRALLGATPLLQRAPIFVERARVRGADVFQTVYFPTEEHSVYRASLTGDLLIIEHAGAAPRGSYMDDVMEAFALSAIDPIGSVAQQYGKIAPLPEAERKKYLFRLTHEHGVYSLGRFATWRNILLDDVVNDIAVIKRLLRAAVHGEADYAARLAAI